MCAIKLRAALPSWRLYWNLGLSEGLFVLGSGHELTVWFRGFSGLELPSWWRKCHCCAKSAGALWDAKSLLHSFLLIQVVFSKYKVKEITVCSFLHLSMQVSCNWQERWNLPVSDCCLLGKWDGTVHPSAFPLWRQSYLWTLSIWVGELPRQSCSQVSVN